MWFSLGLLIVVVYLAYRAAPRDRQEDEHIHGAGQIGMLAALALFGVDYFTSFYYATGEMMSSLHPYGLQQYAYIPVLVIALANIIFGAVYMYSLGVFREGGGSFAAAMRYLGPSLSLIVAVVLIQDYIFTIVVSTLSGVDQLLSLRNAAGINWIWHFLIGASLAAITWFITIRGRGESARVVFTLLGVFLLLTITMAVGLISANLGGVAAFKDEEVIQDVSVFQALFHLLSASMKGLVALSGLEAMSDGIQFVKNEDAGLVKWGRKHLPKWKKIWEFYGGKSGIGRFVQTSFLFYGGLTTFMLTYFSIRFNVYDGTAGRSLVGNLAFIGFDQFSGGIVLFWAYQILAVILLASASMTAYQDLQAITWRNVAIGEIPEVVVYRNPKGTFTRPVTAAFIAAVVIQFLVRGETSHAVPYYGIGVFLPIMAMGLAIRKHILQNSTGKARRWGSLGAGVAAGLAAFIFIGQIVGKWPEGGWVVLITMTFLVLIAHAILLSPAGYRDPEDIRRIIRDKSHVQGPMGDMVDWQSKRTQEYRNRLLLKISQFAELFGIFKPLRFDQAFVAREQADQRQEEILDHESLMENYLANQPQPQPKLGGQPSETAGPDKPEGVG